jgi:exodeoxyribonuclease III
MSTYYFLEPPYLVLKVNFTVEPTTIQEETMNLKVLSYNILEGGDNRLQLIQDIIRKQHPDAVALLEANNQANAETIARELEMQFVFGEANNEYHVAWLSRLPIQRSENHRLAVLSKTLLEIEIAWNGTQLHLFATH